MYKTFLDVVAHFQAISLPQLLYVCCLMDGTFSEPTQLVCQAEKKQQSSCDRPMLLSF